MFYSHFTGASYLIATIKSLCGIIFLCEAAVVALRLGACGSNVKINFVEMKKDTQSIRIHCRFIWQPVLRRQRQNIRIISLNLRNSGREREESKIRYIEEGDATMERDRGLSTFNGQAYRP